MIMAAAAGLARAAHGGDVRALGALREGGSLHEVTYRLTVEQRRDGAPAPTRVEVEQRARVRLAPVDPALAAKAERGAVIEMECSVESFAESWSEGETSAEVVRPKATQEEEPETPEAEALRALAAAVGAADIRVFVIAGVGIGRVTGLDAVMEAPIGALGPEALGVFGPEELARALAVIFSGAGAAHEQGVSHGWTKEDGLDLGAAGGVRLTTRWTPAPGEADAGIASFTGEMTAALLTPGAEAGGPAVSGVITEQQGRCEMRWDTAADRLVSFRRTWSMASDWRLGALALRQTHESALTVTRATE